MSQTTTAHTTAEVVLQALEAWAREHGSYIVDCPEPHPHTARCPRARIGWKRQRLGHAERAADRIRSNFDLIVHYDSRKGYAYYVVAFGEPEAVSRQEALRELRRWGYA